MTFEGSDRPVRALADFSLSVAAGEPISVIGPSGCGKSTMLLLAAGLLAPGDGAVRVADAPVAGPRRATALILQEHGLLPWKTVEDNAALGLVVRGAGRREARAQVAEALARLGLAEFARAYPGELSGGMRQRVGLARAVALDADLVLMDEPLSALDALTREDLQDVLLDLWRRRSHAQVLVTHSIEEAVFLGRRVVVMSPRPGRVAAIVENPEMGEAGIGRARASTSAAPTCASCWRRKAPCIRARPCRARRCCRERDAAPCARPWSPLSPCCSRAGRCSQLRSTRPRCLARCPRSRPSSHCCRCCGRRRSSLSFRVLAAMLIGSALAVPAGLALGRSPRADAVFAPMIFLTYPIPKVVFLPVLMLLLGLGHLSKIALITLIVFFQILVTARDAARAVPEGAVLSVRSLGATGRDVARHVVVPASLPEIFTALRIGTGTAVAVLFLAEATAGTSGLGWFIVDAWGRIDYPAMFAGIIAMALLGVALYELLDVIESWATRWRRAGR